MVQQRQPLQTWLLFFPFASDRDSGDRVEVAIEGLAEEMLGQVWRRRKQGKVSAAASRLSTEGASVPIWPLAVAHRWPEVAQCRRHHRRKWEESDRQTDREWGGGGGGEWQSDRVIETGLDGLEVQRTEAPRPRWLSQVLARIYTEHKWMKPHRICLGQPSTLCTVLCLFTLNVQLQIKDTSF